MKKTLLLLSLVILMGASAIAQKAEVLYFKANLACCAARACATVEKDVKATVEKNFTKDKVVFKQVKLDDPANKALVDKHNAKSQTVVMVVKKRRGETVIDLTDIVRKYSRNNNKAELEKDLVARMTPALK